MKSLNCSNFPYYAFHPKSSDLSSKDQKKALAGTVLLGFTFGVGHLICAISNAIHPQTKQASKVHQVAQTLAKPFKPKATQVGGLQVPKPPAFRTAVLAWGSLVNQPESPIYGAKLETEENFKEAAGLKLPIRMSRLSSAKTPKRRYTLVIDRNATDEKVFAATSLFKTFDEAKENLQKREGTTAAGVSYLKQGEASGDEETFYVNQKAWSGKKGSQITAPKAEEMIRWAQNHHYDAVIWTGLAPNVPTNNGTSGSRGQEILESLKNDPVLLRNTQDYIKLLPYTTALQNKILNNQLN